MITAWSRASKGLVRTEVVQGRLPSDALWLDVVDITADEERLLESTFSIEVPTREEMAGLEASSRLYHEHGTLYLTAGMISHSHTDEAMTEDVTFILTRERIITVRYADFWPFRTFAERASRSVEYDRPDGILLGLMEATVERLGQLLQKINGELEDASREVFANREARTIDLNGVLTTVGRCGDTLSRLRVSLQDKDHVVTYAQQTCKAFIDRDVADALGAVAHDARSLSDQASFAATKISFLLDAILGLIQIDQNRVIKIFSVLAVIFLPPTMVGTVYGMNFTHMPELPWRFGYPFALLLMVISALIPLWWFKRQKWL